MLTRIHGCPAVECIMTNTPTTFSMLFGIRSNQSGAERSCRRPTNGKVTTFGHSDPNIENGLRSKLCCRNYLGCLSQSALPECWLANRKELLVLYINQYFPHTGMSLLAKLVGQELCSCEEKGIMEILMVLTSGESRLGVQQVCCNTLYGQSKHALRTVTLSYRLIIEYLLSKKAACYNAAVSFHSEN